MKIALAHKRLDLKGGTEKDFYRTAQGLRDLGHEIHLFCSEFGVEPPSDVFAHRIPVLPLGRTARLWSLALVGPAIIRKHPCDVVVSFGRMPRADVVRCGGGSHRGFLERLGREGGVRRRLWQRVSVYHCSVLAIEKRQFQAGGFEKIVAVAEEVKNDLMVHYAVPQERIVVLYNGVDHHRFHPARRQQVRSIVRDRWGIPLTAPLVLFVGSGFQRKGLDRLLSVWNAPGLHESYLFVVGDDARLSWYKRQAVMAGGERIVFTGRQEDIENYYAAADVVALPSVQESFGNVILEGLASGLPVVVSREAGAAEILTGSLAEGILNRPDDPKEIENKLLKLLQRSHDPSVLAEARQLAERFSWQNHFRKLEAILLDSSLEISGQNRRGILGGL